MTVPMSVQPPKATDVAATTATVRKRRRRTPAGGAADDCFTCSKRNIKCDRRRPYCSQCLEIGNECSGYKTQLTWNVGVASRGKLRGLSLPIAKSAPVATGSSSGTSSTTSPVTTRKSKSSSPRRQRADSTTPTLFGSWSEQSALGTPAVTSAVATPMSSFSPHSYRHDDGGYFAYERSPSIPATPYNHYNLAQLPSGHSMTTSAPLQAPIAIPMPMAEQSWTAAAAATPAPPPPLSPYPTTLPVDTMPPNMHRATQLQHPQHRHAAHARQPNPLQVQLPLQQRTGHEFVRDAMAHEHHLSASADSLSDVDYMSPLGRSFSHEEMVFAPSPVGPGFESFTGHNSPIPESPVAGLLIEPRSAPTSYPGLAYGSSEQTSSLTSSHLEAFGASLSAKLLQECDSVAGTPPDMDAYSTSAQSNGQYWESYTDCEASPRLQAASLPQSWPAIMDDQNLPVNADLVAKMPYFLDYYEHTMCPSMVLIDGPANPYRAHVMQLARSSRSLQHAICALASCNLRMKRKLSFGQNMGDFPESDDATGHEDLPVSEEYQHRNLAVHLLNEQLNDPVRSRDDSVLATILMLCHYRLAESGIARFHTQFAGVKKILSLRRTSPFPQSRDCAWMEAIFTYFDAISASINDREAQLNTSFFGVMPDSQLLPPAAENLVGCDRELFRTISKLGRLNLLAQNRPVQNLLNLGNDAANPAGGSGLQRTRSYSSNLHLAGDEDDGLAQASISSLSALDDPRSAFWREWKEARIALQSWEFDPQRFVAYLQGPVLPTNGQLRDLGSLSQAFRHAALIYTERLASPNVPSTHNNFRNLVSQVVYYATSLEAGSTAEKFLLWPLFVAGSECVNELQQSLVRSKCREIMSRSGYMNNLAALDVLERLWSGEAQDDVKTTGGATRYGPFNWGRCIGGPGVEVEWIMF